MVDFDGLPIKQEEEEEHKVDIEGLEELPPFQQLLPKAMTSSSLMHGHG